MKTKITFFSFITVFVLSSTVLFGQTTSLRSTDCNITNSLVTTDLYADAVPGGTQYRFRVDNGNIVQTLTKSVRFFSIDELTETLYNTEHSIDVSVEIGGTFGPFGPVCSVTTRAFPIQLRSSDCGRLLNNMGQDVYANVVGADEYYFEVTNLSTSDVDTVTKASRSFRLNDLPAPTFDTEYRVRVSVLLDGALQPYGNECSLFIDVDPNAPRILSEYCGTTFELLAYEYMKTYVPAGATNFEFRITNGPDQFSVETTADSIRFVDFVNLPTLHYAYNTTYDVDVRAFVGGSWTDYGPTCQVSTTEFPYTEVQHLCGQTVSSFNEPISAYAVFSATDYQFEVTDVETGLIETINKSIAVDGGAARRFKLNELLTYGYGKDYSVRVRVRFDGVTHPFGPACTVSSPEPVTQLRLVDCGKTLISLSEEVFADEIENATTYRFEVTNTSTLDVEIIDKAARSFSLSELTDPQWNVVYEVRVAVEYEGLFENFGPVCELNAPQAVLARLRSPDCGRELILMNQAIYSNRSDEDSYTFEFTNMSSMNVEEITKSTRDVRLSELSAPENDVEYQVRISVVRDGQTLPFGPVCSVFAPSSSMLIINDDVNQMSMKEQDEYIEKLELQIKDGSYSSLSNSIVAYPNPTNESVKLKFDNSIENQSVNIVVFDAQGRVVERINNILTADLVNVRLGLDYSQGFYRVEIQNEKIHFNTNFIRN